MRPSPLVYLVVMDMLEQHASGPAISSISMPQSRITIPLINLYLPRKTLKTKFIKDERRILTVLTSMSRKKRGTNHLKF